MNWPLPIMPVAPILGAWFPIAPPVTRSLPQRWFTDEVIVTSSALVFAFQAQLPRPLRTGSGAGSTRCPEHDLALGRVLRPTRAALRSVSGPATTLEHIPARYWFVTDRRTRPQRHISRIRAATSACAEAPHALASSTKSTGQVRHSKRSRMLSGINRLRGANTYESP